MTRRIIFLAFLALLPLHGLFAQSLSQCQYWIDDDYEQHKSVPSSSEEVTLAIDVAALSEGIHFLSVRAQNDEGVWGAVKRKMFYRPAPFAHGSTSVLSRYEYWLDDKFEARKSTASAAEDVALSIDVAPLSEGIHFFNIRAQNSNGMWGAVKRKMFYRPAPFAHDSTSVLSRYEYWLDDKFEARKSTASAAEDVALTIDVAPLSEGTHFFNIRAQNSNGTWGAVKRKMFYRPAPFAHDSTSVLSRYEYWLDDKFEVRKSTASAAEDVALTIDVASLSEGIHFFNVRAQNSNGTWGAVKRKMFYRPAPFAHDSTSVLSRYEYWLDDKLEARKNTASTAEDVALTIDVAPLSEGIHFFNIRAQNSNGTWGAVKRKMFYRPAPFAHDSTSVLSRYEYWLDDKFEARKSTASAAEDVALTIDVASLSEGIHFFNVRAQNSNGTWGAVKRKMFYKSVPRGGELTHYEYWIDDDFKHRTVGECTDTIMELRLDISRIPVGEHTLFFRAQQESGAWGHIAVVPFERTFSGEIIIGAGETFVNEEELAVSTLGMENNEAEGLYAALVNNGTMTADSVWVSDIMPSLQWTFIMLPFDVKMNEIVHDDAGVQYAVRRYDGAGRAENGIGDNWKRVQADETLAAGEGFILQHNAASGSERFVFPASDNLNAIFAADDAVVPLQEHPSTRRSNAGWNLIGNPFPTYYNMENSDFTGAVTVWNGSGYDALHPQDDDVVLHPFQAFFVQRQDKDAITFAAEGRQGGRSDNAAADRTHRPLRSPKQSTDGTDYARTIINLTCGTARTRIVLNESASRDYELQCDAAKFFGTGIDLYTIEDGTAYAINERPLDDGTATVGFSCAEAGTYTISSDVPVWIDGALTTSYTFRAEAGRTLFKLRLGEASAITTVQASHDDDWYTPSGLRLAGKPKSKGIYLQRGQKVVVK